MSETVMSHLSVIEALKSRRSVRAFLSDPVDRKVIEKILHYASRSPSASNIQPWKVHACAGDTLHTLSEELVRTHYADGAGHVEEVPYYPGEWFSPYIDRRRTVGKSLYGLLGIPKGDVQGMQRQYARNYAFFDAPVGLFFTVDRRLTSGHAVWTDLGSFMHGIMLAARHYGLDTCAQQAFARYHKIIRWHLPIGEQEILVCGMSMGYADTAHPANQLVTERDPIDAFTTFSGFSSVDRDARQGEDS